MLGDDGQVGRVSGPYPGLSSSLSGVQGSEGLVTRARALWLGQSRR